MNLVSDRVFIVWLAFLFLNVLLISVYRVVPFGGHILLLPGQFSGSILCLMNVFSPPITTMIMFYFAIKGRKGIISSYKPHKGVVIISVVINIFFISYVLYPAFFALPPDQDLITHYNEAALLFGVINIIGTGPMITIAYSA